jgi:nucleoside-diphosphate-sugar epimerase
VASSIRVYGPTAGPDPPREDARLAATDPYGATKAAADRIARGFWSKHGMAVAVVRAGNVYGGGDRHRSRLVPEAIDAALAGRAAVLRSDGSAPLNLLHVDDAVAAYLAVAAALDVEDPARGARGEAFNVGGEDPRPVAEIAALVGRLAGSSRPPVLGAAPDADAPDARIDATKLRERTGWAPRVSLQDGVARAVAEDREQRAGS